MTSSVSWCLWGYRAPNVFWGKSYFKRHFFTDIVPRHGKTLRPDRIMPQVGCHFAAWQYYFCFWKINIDAAEPKIPNLIQIISAVVCLFDWEANTQTFTFIIIGINRIIVIGDILATPIWFPSEYYTIPNRWRIL